MARERAGVLVVRDGRLALIERERAGRRYWVIPGGGIEPNESTAGAAAREAAEELDVVIRLGPLRVRIDHREEDGSIQRQWYFEATVESDDIRVVGPEREHGPEKGSYTAVWIALDDLRRLPVLPAAVAGLVSANRGVWPPEPIEIDER